ncbi:MAG: Sir2 family NAD-dependent protein deacetylase [Candidatus Sulfotelmatobacter sp.]|jgi:NAD-dependent deacetylase
MLAISPADRLFVLTGAGVSAESGIPTFRGVGGLWRNYRIEEVASPDAWRHDPRLVWEFYSMRRRVAAAAKPNLRHDGSAQYNSLLSQKSYSVVCAKRVSDH